MSTAGARPPLVHIGLTKGALTWHFRCGGAFASGRRDGPRKVEANRELEQFLRGVATRAFRIARLSLRQDADAFDAVQADQIRRYALAENLKRQALDTRSLEEAWRKVPQQERTNRRVAAAAAQCFISLGGCLKAHLIIEEALAEEWDSELVALYAECDGGDTVSRIERAEAWLKNHPDDGTLLFTWIFSKAQGGAGTWSLYGSDGASSTLYNSGTYTLSGQAASKAGTKDVTAR